VKQFRTRGHMPAETEALLVGQATVLRDLVKAKAQ
jgi:hypothetical protein